MDRLILSLTGDGETNVMLLEKSTHAPIKNVCDKRIEIKNKKKNHIGFPNRVILFNNNQNGITFF